MTWPKPKEAMRGFLVLALLACFMLSLQWLMRNVVPEENRDLVNFMLGQLSSFCALGVGYYLGTSKSSADKNDIIRDHANDGLLHVDQSGHPVPVHHAQPAPTAEFEDEPEDWGESVQSKT